MEQSNTRYCWLNINDGTFSNSWGEEDQRMLYEVDLSNSASRGWKLIKFECLNDKDFEFNQHMKLR